MVEKIAMPNKEKKVQIIPVDEVKENDRAVLTYGHFSTIHPGHIRYLKYAKSLGKELVVGIIGDTTLTKYPFNQLERAEALSLLRIADNILLLIKNVCKLFTHQGESRLP